MTVRANIKILVASVLLFVSGVVVGLSWCSPSGFALKGANGENVLSTVTTKRTDRTEETSTLIETVSQKNHEETIRSKIKESNAVSNQASDGVQAVDSNCSSSLASIKSAPLHDILTIVMASSPRPAKGCVLHLKYTLLNIRKFQPELVGVKFIISMDGCPTDPKFEETQFCGFYGLQINNTEELLRSDEFKDFNIELIVERNRIRHGLGGALTRAVKHVKTPFMYVIQDDFLLNQRIKVDEILASFRVNPGINYLRLFLHRTGDTTKFWEHKHDEVIIGNGIQCVKEGITRTCNWSDNNHFVRTDYYRNMLESLPESTMPPEASFNHKKTECDDNMKQYLYGGLNHQAVLCHIDGKYRPFSKRPRSRLPSIIDCPSVADYEKFIRRTCPRAEW